MNFYNLVSLNVCFNSIQFPWSIVAPLALTASPWKTRRGICFCAWGAVALLAILPLQGTKYDDTIFFNIIFPRNKLTQKIRNEWCRFGSKPGKFKIKCSLYFNFDLFKKFHRRDCKSINRRKQWKNQSCIGKCSIGEKVVNCLDLLNPWQAELSIMLK